MTAYDSAYGADPDTSAMVTVAAQGARTVLTGHTLTATLGIAATTVAWSSSTGTFNSSTSLTLTYTPTTIGHQSATCTPSGTAGPGTAVVISWDVTRPLPVAVNGTASTVISTLALQTEALSDSGGADGVTWSTVVQRYTTSGTLEGTETVGGTSTAPTWTPSTIDRDYLVTSTATDTYSRTSVKSRSVAAIAVARPTGDIGADSAQTTLASVTLSGASIVGATSYLWSVEVLKPADATYTSTAAPLAATSQSTSFTPDGPGDWRIKCVATNATGSTTFERQVSQTRPYPVVSSTLGSTEELSGATYAPTLSETAGADAPATPWLTTALLVSDGSSVSVTGPTTTTPSFGSIAVGAAYAVEHSYTDAYGRVGRLSVGVRRTPQSASEATITTGAPAQQSSISGVALALTLVGTASSYAWGARLNSGGAAGGWSTTGFSSSTSATPTYTRPTDDDYEIRCVVTMSDAQTQEARSTVSSTNAKAGGAGIWTTTKEWDFTTDVTNATFAASGSDQSLFAANGTTVKATIRVNTRTGSPTATTTVTSGTGLSQTQTVASAVRYVSIKCTAADTGITFSTPGTVAIDMLLSSVLQAATTEKATVGIGNAVSFSTGNHWALRILRNAGPSHAQYGNRFDANVADYDAAQNADAAQPTDFAVRFIIQGGMGGNVYWTEGSSAYLEGIPTPSGSVFMSTLGAVASAAGAALPLADPFYLTVIDLFTAGAVSNTINVKKVRIQRFT